MKIDIEITCQNSKRPLKLIMQYKYNANLRAGFDCQFHKIEFRVEI